MEEIWKDMKGFEGLYQVSNFGRVRSMKAWNSEKAMHLKHASINKNSGYPFVTLYDGKRKTYAMLHRLVAEAFIPNPENKPQVSHLDETRTNCRVDNLAWATAKENCNMPLFLKRNGDSHRGKKYGSKGKYNHMSKTIIQMDMSGKEIARYESIKYAEVHLGVKRGNISACANGKTNHAYGYKWKFSEEN